MLLDFTITHRLSQRLRASFLLDTGIIHRVPLRQKISWQLTTDIIHCIPARHSKGYRMLLATAIQQKDIRHGGHGYIAGRDDGIVTVNGRPASREIWLMSLKERRIIRSTWSNKQGHYLIRHLDPAGEYLLMVRDYTRNYEPFCYDYVKPATDLTVAEQHALWESWQT